MMLNLFLNPLFTCRCGVTSMENFRFNKPLSESIFVAPYGFEHLKFLLENFHFEFVKKKL